MTKMMATMRMRRHNYSIVSLGATMVSILLLIQGEYTNAFLVGGSSKMVGGGSAAVATMKTTTQLQLIDPISINVGIAAVSAVAGAASQFPKVQELERELEIAKSALTESEQDMVAKMKELEDRLFTIDQEYEQQTAKFKKQYDADNQKQILVMKDRIKQDYEYKLDIRMEEEKSKLLQEKYDYINSMGNKREELFGLRMKQTTITQANEQLEKALAESESELQRLRSAASDMANKKRFIFF